jgi:NADH:ubiquinone oxidoreductase subunit 6 (subunit J)
MATLTLLNEYQLTGALLILAYISYAIGATLPIVGEKGNMSIFTLPVREYLSAVAANAAAWRWANIFMGAAIVFVLAGLMMLTTTLEGADERILSRLGLMGVSLAAVLWVIFSAFRASVTIMAAEELAAKGAVPAYYEPLAQWGSALFYAYAVVGFLALAAYGSSLLRVGLVPGWVGWGTIIFSIGLLVLLFINGDTLPVFHYLPPLLIGIFLLVRG